MEKLKSGKKICSVNPSNLATSIPHSPETISLDSKSLTCSRKSLMIDSEGSKTTLHCILCLPQCKYEIIALLLGYLIVQDHSFRNESEKLPIELLLFENDRAVDKERTSDAMTVSSSSFPDTDEWSCNEVPSPSISQSDKEVCTVTSRLPTNSTFCKQHNAAYKMHKQTTTLQQFKLMIYKFTI